MRRALLVVALALALAAAVPGLARAGTWCGGAQESAVDRPDAVAALAWHVVYAYPSDGVDRFASLVEPIVADLAAVDAWWRGQDPTRAIRWDLASFPDCASQLGQLDISAVKLAHDATWFGGADRFARLRDDLVAAGFDDPDKKELIYYDGPLDVPVHECGVSRTGFPATGGADSYSIVYLDSRCGDGLGQGLFPAIAAVHEMTHSMYALVRPEAGQPGPPHACPDDAGHPCDSRDDLLYPSSAIGSSLAQKILDVGRDDYYAHSGTWWDVQDSLFLSRLDSPDQAPPSAPGPLTTKGLSGRVQLFWQAATDDVGPVSYEVYRDGVLMTLTTSLTYAERTPDGVTHTYGIRSRDEVGRLGGTVSLRFLGGLGVVDAEGVLVADTVSPLPVVRPQARVTPRAFILSWPAAIDAGGVAGYRVYRDGRAVARTQLPSFSLPPSRAVGTWVVRAFDRAGNLADPSPPAVVLPRRRD